MRDQATRAHDFLGLHQQGAPLLLPNPWDAGSAKILASMGFSALATTSSGYAATLGRRDGAISREEALAHAASIVVATDLPVSADLENGFADSPAGVAATVELAVGTGLAGLSIEDFTGDDTDPIHGPIYAAGPAAERVLAAAEAAHAGQAHVVVTARCENYLHGRPHLSDTIARLQSYQEAGADVLYAPGLAEPADIRSVVDSVDLPVNVLALAGGPSVAELARLGVRRVSVGGSFAFAALGALTEAARELLEDGSYGYIDHASVGQQSAQAAFDD